MPIITVSQLNNYMKRYIDQNIHLSDLWVKGEISNCKKHYSGHIYLSLKDSSSVIKGIIFKSVSQNIKFDLKDGMSVIVFGKLSVYERDGQYQLYIESVTPDGVGELYATYEKLKLKLEKEGLFDVKHKKPIPEYPQKIGIVTSSSGAALRDILNVISRRYKLASLCIYHAMVQGVGAADTICEGLEYFSNDDNCDVVILARGGGSIEDLWSFNEEKTARAIFTCSKPVITGIGHETDYTISDFVADMRAPTPSAAAEMCTPSSAELKAYIISLKNNLNKYLEYHINAYSAKVENMSKENIYFLTKSIVEKNDYNLSLLTLRIKNLFDDKCSTIISKLKTLSASLELLDPHRVLKRGYSIAFNSDGHQVNIENLGVNDEIKLIMDGGHALCKIMEVCHEQKE